MDLNRTMYPTNIVNKLEIEPAAEKSLPYATILVAFNTVTMSGITDKADIDIATGSPALQNEMEMYSSSVHMCLLRDKVRWYDQDANWIQMNGSLKT